MGGNAGGVIIRSAIKTVADTSAVLDHCDQSKRAKLENILAKDPANWTVGEFRFVMRRIEEAHDNQC
jgi:hypothetical protein